MGVLDAFADTLAAKPAPLSGLQDASAKRHADTRTGHGAPRQAVRSRVRFNYYEAFNKQVGYCEEITQNLLSAFKAGEMGTEQLMAALHVVENDADSVDHDLRIHLLTDLIVPADRDGMVMLANSVENATDKIEDIAIFAYIYGAKYMQPRMRDVLEHMAASVTLLREACERMDSYERFYDEIYVRVTGVAQRESACDAIFISAMHNLYATDEMTGEKRQITAALYEKFEDAMDSLEQVAESMEAIIAQSR